MPLGERIAIVTPAVLYIENDDSDPEDLALLRNRTIIHECHHGPLDVQRAIMKQIDYQYR